ncbi:MAG: hypothetical protein QOD02_1471 [Mycobacterium sp.]|jgi:hypothetical protein|nr:hypothetical protein [Mycobacterium sp.]
MHVESAFRYRRTNYTHDWVYFNVDAAELVFCARTRMGDLGDGTDYTATNWTWLKYADAGLFSFEEDIYNPANFISLIQRWEAAAERARLPFQRMSSRTANSLARPPRPLWAASAALSPVVTALIVGGNQRAVTLRGWRAN